MRYVELAPPPALASHVTCVWFQAVGDGGFVQRVLPDGCADVIWGGGRLHVAGPATGPVLVDIAPGDTFVGVRFGPSAAGAALGLPAVELRDLTVDLAEIWGRTGARLADRMAGEAPREQMRILADAVATRLSEAPGPDPIVAAAASALGRPEVRVREVSRDVGLGERHLRRRFERAIGYGPKTLHRVLRLLRFIELAERHLADGIARAAAEAGYHDQPHLTRECTELTGLPPAALLAARSVGS
jgi:AraC-like DNA-binding protein